jgi:prepilin-type N-terminal cleavage/methylation domain-containing protein
MKRGFTIIELLMVVAILAVLLGIVTTAATASVRQSRDRQAQAMKQTLQNGIAAYRVRKDKWPEKLEKWADQEHDGTVGYLSRGDYDKVVQEILRVSTGRNAKNRVMDPVGLAVIPVSESDGKIDCMNFRAVTTKNNKHAKQMEYNEMTVVYPKTDTGRAYRYVIEYNAESDEVTVMTQGEFTSKTGDNWTGGEVWR